jgi:Raf kinase inhibitor-like YbhB/YbcL family protein
MENAVNTGLLISSPAFNHEESIPSKYTCEGENISPPIRISGIPKQAKSLALVVEDPDATDGVFDHWILWNIPPEERIPEKSVPGIPGKNSYGKMQYSGPCPPSGTHRYYFRIFALDIDLNLKAGANKKALQEAMKGHVILEGELMGLYQKKTTA